MSGLTKERKNFLREKFGNRVNFDKIERKLYSHDIAAVPALVKPIIGNTTPDAVIQPTTEEELVELVKWGIKNNIPLTPRGKASSGYGGVLPMKKGIVIDFFRMNKILKINHEEETVTVQAGIIWEKMDRAINKEGLTLRLYPTSYPSSTAGGWLAQGGAGLGSYEFGWFKQNVVEAKVVLPDGSVKEFKGDDLDLISDAEGITGFISELTVRVQKLEDLDVVSIGCSDTFKLQNMLSNFVAQEIPIWSLIFINPRMAELKNKTENPVHHGHREEKILLPASYITTLAFRKKDKEEVMTKLENLLKACDSEILSDKIAHHEWKHRFKIMVVKRLGPSLVPVEIVIPLSSLDKVMKDVEHTVNQPVVKEGVLIQKGRDGKPEVVILGFIPSDQRKFSYNFVFSLALSIIKIAENNGGRSYSTGIYFSKKAKDVLGEKRFEKLKEYKAKIDPKNLLNPGKVLGSGLIGNILGLAQIFEPMIRPFGNYVITKVGEQPTKSVRNIPPDVVWYAYSCSQCGYCVEECDQFYGRGWESQSPRGKWYWLREYIEGREEWNQFMVDTIISCTTCELCNIRCSADLPIEPSWMKLRGQLINEEKRMTFPPFEMMAQALGKEGNIWAGYRKNRSDWFPKDLKEKHGEEHKSKVVYFAGCTASYVEHDIGLGAVRLMDEAGIDFTYLGEKENCCGTPMLAAGKWDEFAEVLKKNIQMIKDAGADTVVSSCPACDMMWRQFYSQWAKKLGIEYDIKAKHYSELLADKINSGEFKFPENNDEKVTVTWHDSCHIGRVSGVYEPPRELIKAIPNVEFVEMEHNRDMAHCCGSVLTLLKEPNVAADIGEVKLNEAIEAGASKILALCPCCQFQMRVSADAKKSPIEIEDLASFASKKLGYTLPDPHPEVRAQWAVFEAMIKLMTPQGFADLMGEMWKELIDSMPYGMGSMMRTMAKIPGALELMKPMFPILFPKLLPMMMPKVMSTMLEKVGEKIPMPDYMREQMPQMMPKVMDNLMPHMIDDLVPLVSQPMIDYLKKH